MWHWNCGTDRLGQLHVTWLSRANFAYFSSIFFFNFFCKLLHHAKLKWWKVELSEDRFEVNLVKVERKSRLSRIFAEGTENFEKRILVFLFFWHDERLEHIGRLRVRSRQTSVDHLHSRLKKNKSYYSCTVFQTSKIHYSDIDDIISFPGILNPMGFLPKSLGSQSQKIPRILKNSTKS